ncbi:HNH endonuclease [Candidatus Woesearchaeota archaeon]|nr:HNH endonuclease [Candidatus Woesearchaeota archaeon]
MKKGDYQAYKTQDGKKKTIHSRVGEKKYDYDKIPADFVIHHIDGDKNNNQYYNLILLHKKDHRRIHIVKSLVIKSVQPSKEKLKEKESE